MDSRITFHGHPYNVEVRRFPNGGRWPCILLVDPSGDMLRVSVNFLEPPTNPQQVALRDYSEFAGIGLVLEVAGIIGFAYGYVKSGYVDIPLHPLLVPCN
jgi:hypothetical protein